MIKIYTYFHKRPDFADIQIRSLRKYLQEDYELTVFNNAKFDADKNNYNEINRICNNYGVIVMDIEKEQSKIDFYQGFEDRLIGKIPHGGAKIFHDNGQYSSPNVAVAYSLCYIWDKFMAKETGKTVFLQHDMFLMEPINFADYMQDSTLCYIPQSRTREDGTPIHYMWNTFFLADISKLPAPETINWWCGGVDGIPVDVGGQTYKYLEDHPEIKLRKIGFDGFGPFGSQLIKLGDKSLLHYYRGSNWDHRTGDWHDNKTKWLTEILDV